MPFLIHPQFTYTMIEMQEYPNPPQHPAVVLESAPRCVDCAPLALFAPLLAAGVEIHFVVPSVLMQTRLQLALMGKRKPMPEDQLCVPQFGRTVPLQCC